MFVGAAESGEGQPAGRKHHFSTDRQTDSSVQACMFAALFLHFSLFVDFFVVVWSLRETGVKQLEVEL